MIDGPIGDHLASPGIMVCPSLKSHPFGTKL
jgi:hypothetical protein